MNQTRIEALRLAIEFCTFVSTIGKVAQDTDLFELAYKIEQYILEDSITHQLRNPEKK